MKPPVYHIEEENRTKANILVIFRPSRNPKYKDDIEVLVRGILRNSTSKYADPDGILNIGWFLMGTKSLPYLEFILNEFIYSEDFPFWSYIEEWYNFNALFL